METGTPIFVKTSLGWLKGTYYKRYANGHAIEIQKLQRGSRRYLPKEAETIFPYSYRFCVVVKDIEKDTRPAN